MPMSSPYGQSWNNSPSAAAATSSRLTFFHGGSNKNNGGNSGSVLGVSKLRSSSAKNPPELLLRAVTDCLSSSTAHYGSPSASSASSSSTVVAFEASGILLDYLAYRGTTDLAYNVIIEHTIAEMSKTRQHPLEAEDQSICEEGSGESPVSSDWKKNERGRDVQRSSQCNQQWKDFSAGIPQCRVRFPIRRSQKTGDKITLLQKLVSP